MSTKTLMSLQRSAAKATRNLSSAAPATNSSFTARSATEMRRAARNTSTKNKINNPPAPSIANESSNSSRIEAQRALRIKLANTPKDAVNSSKVPRNRLQNVESVGTSAASMSATARHRMQGLRGVGGVTSEAQQSVNTEVIAKSLDTSVAQLSATALHRAARNNGVKRNATRGSHITPSLSVGEILQEGMKKGILYNGIEQTEAKAGSSFASVVLGVAAIACAGVAGLSYFTGGPAFAFAAAVSPVPVATAPVRNAKPSVEVTKQPLWLQRERA
ncbi:hypothetical protein TL16_g05517 [Triparma laevis f. inornata]|uniref:Uncharacterized protein n=2 Tax=Triparma laevis TaxID=1534972 RepID=A0A9W7FDX5_9STRA|nr:hypothetical protein TL16_g05517 [Triparma laevis f. inornata]GMI10361.1 hypothetical protein TrLO_g9880 [Triparma laevis f. longispina]